MSKRQLPIAALAIGCMTPDLYRLFTQQNFPLFHQWSGIFSFTLWLGLAFCLLWYVLYRPVVYRTLNIKDPLALANWQQICKFCSMTVLSVLIGIATHLIWDGLTHADFRTFAFRDFLQQPVQLLQHVYPIHRVLQIGTSILTLPLICWMSWHYYQQHRQSTHTQPKVRLGGSFILTLAILLGLCSAWDYARYISSVIWQKDLYYFIGRCINEFSQAFLSTWTIGCILFLFLDREH